MGRTAILIAIGAAVALGGLWAWDRAKLIQAGADIADREERLAAAIDQIAEGSAALEDSIAEWTARRKALEAAEADAERRAADAEAAAGIAVAEYEALADSIRGQIDPALRPAYDRLEQAFWHTVAENRKTIAAQQEQITALRTALACADSAFLATRRMNIQLQAALEEANGLREYWRKKANPSIATKIVRATPAIAAGIGLGYLIAQ